MSYSIDAERETKSVGLVEVPDSESISKASRWKFVSSQQTKTHGNMAEIVAEINNLCIELAITSIKTTI